MELKDMRYYTCRPPGMLIGLIHDDEGIKRATLELCHDLWGALQEVEKKALEDAWFQGYIIDLCWAQNCWVREVFISLLETNFTSVPPDIEEELEFFARGWHSSVPVENSFKILSDRMATHRAGYCSRTSRWECLLSSELLEDHDRKRVPIDEHAFTVKASGVGGHVFDFKNRQNTFSLCEESMEAMSSKDPDDC